MYSECIYFLNLTMLYNRLVSYVDVVQWSYIIYSFSAFNSPMLSFYLLIYGMCIKFGLGGRASENSGLAQVQLCLVDLTFTKIGTNIHQDLCTRTKIFS